MPKLSDVKKVLIIGSGPIVIGQACEFDYSGTQACKALRELGYEIVLVNSNPATIMTDPGMADRTYIEPLTLATLEEIIARERPDALLPNLGGQTALNLSAELSRTGVLAKYGVRIIGVQADAIERGEDRVAFKETMNKLGIDMPRSAPALTVEAAEKIAADLGYPVVIRPAYTMGGTGGGLVYNVEELRVIAARGLAASFVGQILVEESVLGWEELELEVVRDAKNRMITVCFIENIDAMGVHTGDSFCAAPMLTIAPELQQRLQKYSYAIVEAIQVIGGTNVQFAHDPKSGRVVVIEINPRTSRSSALASKATGFPIALVSAKLAGGLNLEDLPYWREGTLDKYTPWGDYVVIKFARWAFEKFPDAVDRLGTQMRAVGEVMSIGKNYKEAFQKAIRSLESGRYGLGFAKDFHAKTLEELMLLLNEPTSERHFIMYEALRKGAGVEELFRKTHIKHWFIEQMKELVELEERILRHRGQELPDALLARSQEGRVRRPLPGEAARGPRAGPAPAPDLAGPGPRLRAGAGERGQGRRLLLFHLPRPRQAADEQPPQDHGPRGRAEPDRPGDRVRLLLRPRRLRAARGGLRDDHGQLQPRDGLHRLRHVGPALLRTADRGGRARDLRKGAARGGRGAVRRADAAEPRRRAGGRRGQDPRHHPRRHRPRRGPGPVPHDHARARDPAARVGDGGEPGGGLRGGRADRLPADAAPLLRARRARDGRSSSTRRCCGTTSSRRST